MKVGFIVVGFDVVGFDEGLNVGRRVGFNDVGDLGFDEGLNVGRRVGRRVGR